MTRDLRLKAAESKGGWRDIASAPRDGGRVWVKRVYNDAIVKEGWAVWGVNSDDAPMRRGLPGDLGGTIAPDLTYADTARWLNEDRRYSFPEPTHWLPEPPTENDRWPRDFDGAHHRAGG